MSRFVIITLISCALASCVTNEATEVNAPKSTQDRLGTAVVSPLNDFNIMQTGIPPVLNEAVKNPYQQPPVNNCKGITEQVELLDKALGPDLDASSTTGDQSDLEKGGQFAQDEAVGGVERTIQGAVPFRSWIRKLSGAEKRSKELSTAIAAGIVRRAFLKGMGQERGCEPPAAPLKHPVPDTAPDAKPDPATTNPAGAPTLTR